MSVDRLAQGLRKMVPGSFGGQSRVVTPVVRRPLPPARVVPISLPPLAPTWVETDGSILDNNQTIQIGGFAGYAGETGDALTWFLAFTNPATTFVSAGQITGVLQPGSLTELHTEHVDGMTLMVLTGVRLPGMTGIRVVVNNPPTTSADFASVFGRFDAGTVAPTLDVALAGTSDGASLTSGPGLYALAVLGTQNTVITMAGEVDQATLVEVSASGGDLALAVLGYRGGNQSFTATDTVGLRYAYATVIT